jgi:hypothetical protein
MQEETAKVSNIIHESFTGARVVKAFAMERYELKVGTFQRSGLQTL